MKKKGYFVSYQYTMANGFGNGRCYTRRKIKSFDDIEAVEKLIREANTGFEKVMIVYYSTKSLKL